MFLRKVCSPKSIEKKTLTMLKFKTYYWISLDISQTNVPCICHLNKYNIYQYGHSTYLRMIHLTLLLTRRNKEKRKKKQTGSCQVEINDGSSKA